MNRHFHKLPENVKEERYIQSAKLLKTVLISLISVLSIYIVVEELLNGFSIGISGILIFSETLLLVVCYILLIFNYLYLSAILTILICFAGMTLTSFFGQGVRDSGVVTYIIIVIFSTLVLGRPAAVITTLFSIASIWSFVYLEKIGIFVHEPLAIELTARDLSFIMLAVMVLTILFDRVLHLYNAEINRSRLEYQLLNQELQERNQQISAYNEELRISKEKAEESDRLKTAFLANLSHEIRTPMNGIIGFSELALLPDVTNEQRKEYNTIIAKNCKQLLELVNDIIDISKIESGVVEINRKPFDLNKLLQGIYDIHSFSASNRGLTFMLSAGFDDDHAMIMSDSVKLHQVVNNLVGNAIKFTSKGTVGFGYSLKDQMLEFFITDTGIGIPYEYQKTIFNRFTQVNTGKTRLFGGTGLGLSIAKAYVEKLGGQIWFHSEENEGSVFFFTLPYESVETAEEITQDYQPFASVKLKVLLVEDVLINEILFREILKKYNFEIIVARTGEEALEKFANAEDISLILMDIKLPGIDGYEVTRRIRRMNKLVPVIAQTAYALSDDWEKARLAGCNDYITKPVTPAAVEKVIRRVLKQ